MSKKKSAFPYALSTSALSELLGITPARLGQLVAAGIIKKQSHGVYLTTAVADYCAFLRGGGAEDAGEDGKLDLRQERAELVHIQRRIAERELARLEERFVDVETVGARLTAEFTVVKLRMRGLPNEVAPKLCLMTNPAEIAACVRKEVDLILAELSSGKDIVEKTLQESRDEK